MSGEDEPNLREPSIEERLDALERQTHHSSKTPNIPLAAIVGGMLVMTAALGYNIDSTREEKGRINERVRHDDSQWEWIEQSFLETAQLHGLNLDVLYNRRKLQEPRHLPYFGTEVSTSTKKELSASAVTILARGKGAKYNWYIKCSGNKTAINGVSYILTATHCLDSSIDRSFLPPGTKAAEVSSAETSTYAIGQASSTDKKVLRHPIADVSRISRITDKRFIPDVALLEVEPRSEEFNKLPALDAGEYAYTIDNTKQGMQAFAYSTPDITAGVSASSTGTYLGRVRVPEEISVFSRSNEVYDVVGFTSKKAVNNPCLKGGSGHTAVLADGTQLNAASSAGGDSEAIEGINPSSAQDSTRSWERKLIDESLLYMDLSKFVWVCHYTTIGQQTFKYLRAGLDIKYKN